MKWLWQVAWTGMALSMTRVVLAQEAPPMTRNEAPTAQKSAVPASASQDAETQFEFYEMLPKFEVVIPEQDGVAPAAGPGTGPVQKPGAYILQAGSFRNHADADRVRALIAMQGVESKIQKVTIDRDTWHRVRVGPVGSRAAAAETLERLKAGGHKGALVGP